MTRARVFSPTHETRRLRLALYAAGLLPLYQRVTHFGRRIRFSKEDGWYYPYSLLNDFDLFAKVIVNHAVDREIASGVEDEIGLGP